MARSGSRQRIAQLRLSALGFALLTGVLAVSYFSLLGVLTSTTPVMRASDQRFIVLFFAVPAMPGAALSWWLLVVLPRRSSALAGAGAGLLTILIAPLGVGIGLFAYGGFSRASQTPQQIIALTLSIWLIGLVILFATPQGWGMLLVGVAVGAFYGSLFDNHLPVTPCEEATSSASQSLEGDEMEARRMEREAADASQG